MLAAVLSILASATHDVEAQAGPVVEAATLERHPLPATQEKQILDGATAQNVVFRARTCSFHYTPPAAWEIKSAGTTVNLRREKITATLGLQGTDYEDNSAAQPPTPNDLKNFEQETLSKVVGADGVRAVPVTTLPFRIGKGFATASTVFYERSGKRYALQRIKSWGNSWQVELEVTGPEAEFLAQGAACLQSLCSIEMRTNIDDRSEAVAREKDAIALMDEQQTSARSSANGAKVRGRIR